jgi:hypothetical protein
VFLEFGYMQLDIIELLVGPAFEELSNDYFRTVDIWIVVTGYIVAGAKFVN